MFMSGIFGKFVEQIPLGVILALLISLIEAFFVLPAHIAKWVKPGKLKRDRQQQKRAGFWHRTIQGPYMGVIKNAVKLRYLTLGCGLLFVVGSLVMGANMRKVLFPGDDIEIFFIRTESPTGSSLEQTQSLIKPVEDAINQLPNDELKNFMTTIGQHNLGGQILKRGSEYSQTTVFLTQTHERDRSADAIINELKEKTKNTKGLVSLSFERVNPGPPVGKPVDVGVRGKNYDEIMIVVGKLTKILSTFEGVSDLENTYVLGKKEYRLQIKPAEAAAAGISVAELGSTVRAAYEGIVATTVRKLEEEMDVRISLTEKERTKGATLNQLKVPNRVGNLIPLARVAEISQTQGLAEYQHENNRRQVKILGEVDIAKTSATEVKK